MTASEHFINIQAVASEKDNDDEGWAYGEVWREGSPDDAVDDSDVRYVEILRGDTGRGFDDSLMLDLVGYLGSQGIRATYDSFTAGMEPAAIKTYVLKVEAGSEDEAMTALAERERNRGGEGAW